MASYCREKLTGKSDVTVDVIVIEDKTGSDVVVVAVVEALVDAIGFGEQAIVATGKNIAIPSARQLMRNPARFFFMAVFSTPELDIRS